MKVKQTIQPLYRSGWLETANFVFISACINCGHTAEEGIRRFQKWMNLDEYQMDTDGMKTSFYRSQKKFRDAVSLDRENFLVDLSPDLVTRDDIKEAMKEALDELVTNSPLLLLETKKRRPLSKKYNCENQLQIEYQTPTKRKKTPEGSMKL